MSFLVKFKNDLTYFKISLLVWNLIKSTSEDNRQILQNV